MRPFGAIAQPKMTPYGIISAWGDAMYFQRIRDVREDHDKTQQEIADMLHMQRSVYRRSELGERELPVWALVKLSEYYGVTTDYLLGLGEKK